MNPEIKKDRRQGDTETPMEGGAEEANDMMPKNKVEGEAKDADEEPEEETL